MSLFTCSVLLVTLAGADVPTATSAIAERYAGMVKQAFETHCADCHGKTPDNLPADARATAQKKSKKAHKKLNMDDGFPFRSKWSLQKLMAEIRDEVEDEDMPPKKYMKQKGRTISGDERRAIAEWARAAETSLKSQ
jgi:mono/diheme cytochrome c family protein